MITNCPRHQVVCCLASLALAFAALTTCPPPARAADGGATAVIVEVGGKLVKEKLVNAVKSWASEHTRYYPDGNTCVLPLKDMSGSRISFNFNHRSWVPRGGSPVKVKMTIHGVSDHVRNNLRVVLKADKKGRTDRDRTGVLQHGSTFMLTAGTSADRAYYFVERGTKLSAAVPVGAFILLERVK